MLMSEVNMSICGLCLYKFLPPVIIRSADCNLDCRDWSGGPGTEWDL